MRQSRRQFLISSSAMAAAIAMPSFLVPRTASAVAKEDLSSWKITGSHWGAIRAKVENGKVVDVKPFEYDERPTHMINGIKGLIHGEARVRYPMVRLDWLKNRKNPEKLIGVENRGDNRFVRVSWKDALDYFYEELERVQTKYGPWALHISGVGWRSTGQVHQCHGHLTRAISMHGNFHTTTGDYSTGAGQVILPYVLGSTEVYSQGTSWVNILDNSKNIVFWASDPIKNLQVGWNCEGHESYKYLAALKEKIAKGEINVVSVDPIKTHTQNYLGCEHKFINPLTDVAFMLAIAHTLYKENLYDKDFMDKYTVGFDLTEADIKDGIPAEEAFVPYLLGKTHDKVEKTPEWAEKICGVSAEEIRKFARFLANGRTQLIFGWAIQRQQHGEQPYWMGAVLAAMLGQIGLPGGGISFAHHYSSIGIPASGAAMPGTFKFSLDSDQPIEYPSKDYHGYSATVPIARAIDSILAPVGTKINYNGQEVTYSPYKVAIYSGSNQWHRQSQRNKMKEAFRKLETVISIDYNWTATCRFSDIVLPACTPFERNDIDMLGSYSNRGVIAMQQLIKPLYESRSDFDIFADLVTRYKKHDKNGRREEYTGGKTEMEWVTDLYNECREANAGKFDMPDFDTFWKKGYVLFPEGKPWTRHEDFRKDPELKGLGTESKKIEIFSYKINDYGYEECKGHPMWFEKAERSHGGPKSDKYQFWMQSAHPNQRLHSQLCESEEYNKDYRVQGREPLYMNAEDAAEKGIKDGDLVRIFNDRGQAIVGAVISPNYPRRVVRLHEGAWYSPEDEKIGSIDTYGDPNNMTLDIGSSELSQAVSAHTCVVDIEKYEGEAPKPNGFTGPIIVKV